MPTFDLAASAALVGVALFSGALFRPTQPDPKGIPIPEEYGQDTNTPPSPFAVTTPADILEGFPVRESQFWRRTRATHLLIAALLAGAVAVDVGAFTAALVSADEGTGGGGVARNAITHLLNGLVALYLLVLSFIALARSRGPVDGEDTTKAPWLDRIATKAPWLDRIALHEHVVLHQCAVGIPASLLGAAVALIPSYGSGFGEGAGAGPSDDPAFLAHLVLLALATALIMGVPMGPELYLPLAQIYDEKVAGLDGEVAGLVQDADEATSPAAIESSTEPTTERTPLLPTSVAISALKDPKQREPTPNVAAVRTASLWSTLLFSYTTPVVWRGYNTLNAVSDSEEGASATFDIADLPILPADMRATYNYSKMRAELARRSSRATDTEPSLIQRVGAFFKLNHLLTIPGLRLARAVLRANAGALALEAALAAGSAGLFYVPAWMTRGLVKWLEDQERAADAMSGLFNVANATMELVGNAAVEFVGNATVEVMASVAGPKPFTWTPYDSFAPVYANASTILTAAMDPLAGVAAIDTPITERTASYASAWLTSALALAPRTGDARWGWVWCAGLFASKAVTYMITAQLWSISTTVIQVRIKEQLNSVLFAKTLVRKDVAGGGGAEKKDGDVKDSKSTKTEDDKPTPTPEDDDFSSRAQVMTLMTTDVDRVSEFAWHLFSLIDSPIEIVIGSWFLYDLLGPSCFVGLAATLAFLPMNHFAGKIVVSAQDNLMRARDERVALMNEVLGAIRMLKFMAWERSFEARVLRVREKELKYQRMNYVIETLWNAIWNGSPILVTLVAFWHYAVLRGQPLGPATAFTSIMVFTEMKFALNALPETFINMLQSLVSLRRIEKYLGAAEVKKLEGLGGGGASALGAEPTPIELRSCTLTWPQERASGTPLVGIGGATPARAGTPAPSTSGSTAVGASGLEAGNEVSSSTSTGLEASTTSTTLPGFSTTLPGLSTPRPSFILQDLTLSFPPGALSLVCGKLGSGKTLLLLGLLGEADVLAGQLSCPRSPPDALAVFAREAEEKGFIAPESWIVPGVCAYVPQAAWLRNASIKDNILFSLPYDEARYTAVLDACALTADLDVLEDGDAAEIGERGVNLSGGQKARVSLARAVYSRAETLLLDDVLSAVDAHTAQHLFAKCLRGPLMEGRTVVLVSHHVQLCVGGAGKGSAKDKERKGAEYVVALDNGRVKYAGDVEGFRGSGVMAGLVQAVDAVEEDEKEEQAIEEGFEGEEDPGVRPSELKTAPQPAPAAPAKARKPPRKLVEEEKRAVGRIGKDIWLTYFQACGDKWYWAIFIIVFVVSALSPVAENGWLRYWSAQELTPPSERKSAGYYIGIYAAVALAGLVVTTLRWFSLYGGSIHASRVLYKRLLESVLFANIRFHDTVSRGRVLNRFGKDFEGIDSSLSDNFGRTAMYSLSTATTIITVSVVGGPPFVAAALVIGFFYYQVGKVYGQTSRDMRRLDSVTRSPLYSLYGETISGVTILRAFGASTKFMRDMLRCVDTNANPYYWMWGVNRWLSVRFNLLSSAVVGVTAVVVMLTPRIDAAFAGFALAFANSITGDLLFMVRRFVGLEQSMVALERVKEYSELKREAPEFVEPRPPAAWPERGEINVEDLVIQYAPELPPVLHGLTFSVKPGEKVAVLGRTGSGKSTLALSFFRFVEATQGKIFIDGLDIAKVGLTDLRSRLTIIPQDPTILSGTLRSTLDVFEEYEDAEIYEALRRVHLIPSEDSSEPIPGDINVNVFRNLDGVVSEGGENFSTGEKQLLCMARAILKRSKVLFMDEATASVDYATDELIGKTIRQEFADSTILTIAHRLRTVIDYDRVMLLDNGRIAEFDSPATLLRDTSSKFYSLCKATGKEEFAMLKRLAGA